MENDIELYRMTSAESLRLLLEAINWLENENRAYREELIEYQSWITQLEDDVNSKNKKNLKDNDGSAFERAVLETIKKNFGETLLGCEIKKQSDKIVYEARNKYINDQGIRIEASESDEVVFITSNEYNLDMVESINF